MTIAHFLVGRCNPGGLNGVHKSAAQRAMAQAGLGHDVSIFGLSAKPAIPIPGVVSCAADPHGVIARHDAGLVVEPTVPALARHGQRAAAPAREEFSCPRTARALVEGYARYAAKSRAV